MRPNAGGENDIFGFSQAHETKITTVSADSCNVQRYNPFETGLITRCGYLVCTQGPFANRHRFQSF